jgi:hypothetical protein
MGNATMSTWIYFLHPPREHFAETMTDEESRAWNRHFEWLGELFQKGILLLAGPTAARSTPESRSLKLRTKRPPGARSRRTRPLRAVTREVSFVRSRSDCSAVMSGPSVLFRKAMPSGGLTRGVPSPSRPAGGS